MIKEAKLLGSALGMPCLDGVEEAEAQCALLNLESLCDACFSSDSDIFLFGAKTVYRDICLGEGGYVVCYEMADIEEKLGFGRNSLIALALLLGSDYSQGVHGLGQEKACEIVRSIGEDFILQKAASEGLAFAKKPRNSKKQAKPKDSIMVAGTNIDGGKHDSEGLEQILLVIDAYLNPKCHSADSHAVYKALADHSFQRIKLHEICAQFFEWPPEKTDAYILPKIAERNLRRFATLRSASTELGVNPPLDKMPVKCPVSEIIKARKVQGRECFEVSWNDLDGLETSIVPADLVERACAQKIEEFEEKQAMKKKKQKPQAAQNHPKPRQKKTKQPRSSSSVPELSLKLQDLVLDTAEEVKEEGYTMNHHNLFLFDSPAKEDCDASMDRFGSGPSSTSETEVIDLLTPCPEARSCRVSRCCQENNTQCVSVIELSDDSEAGEASPDEHDEKARELRMFLESIRKDII